MMSKDLQAKVDKLKKSMYKTVRKVKEKNAIEDVLDSDRVAEMSPDSIPASRGGVLQKDLGERRKGKKGTILSREKSPLNSPDTKNRKEDGVEYKKQSKKDDKIFADAAKNGGRIVSKGEDFVRNMMKNFETISKAYMEKLEKDSDNAEIGHPTDNPKKMSDAQNATFGSSISTGKPGSLKGHKGDMSPGQIEGEKAAKIRRDKLKAQKKISN
jgi:hypothetical protein